MDRFGIIAAKALHSPDNHLGIDHYLESYIANHYDMSAQEWLDFKEICASVMNNPEASKNEKLQAEFLSELCDHKMMRDGSTHSKKIS